ncbi:MAG TPA: hypothetical protein VMU64_03135 [Acidimicrobiales bacterium]|nr:hypothetical protein [Acidimicrobiales bacterium]
MMAPRLHHPGYSFLWDLVDLWRSAFDHTGPLRSPALLPLPALVPTRPSTTAEQVTHTRH